MLQKKICMFGSPVGTRLIRACAYGIFSDMYKSSIGVAIHRKLVQVRDMQVKLLVWDLDISEEFQRVRASYIRGISGYVVVEDPNDETSMRHSQKFHELVRDAVGRLPSLTFSIDAKNESGEATIESSSLKRLVDESFSDLARRMLKCEELDADGELRLS